MTEVDRHERTGPGIREFLRYYVLVLLQEEPMSPGEIRSAVERESAANREYRPSGQLRIGRRDLRLVLGQLRRRELIAEAGRRWRLTDRGRDKLAGYEQREERHQDGKQRAARKLVKLMGKPVQEQRVLDVGTGEGFLAFKLADGGYRVLGIDSGGLDYSTGSVRAAREKCESRGGEVEFRQTSIAELAATRERFDYVVSSQAMHCMEDQAGCLHAVRRLLKPGGEFLCMDFLVGLDGFLHHGWHSFLAISREEWEDMLPQHGFETLSRHKAGDYLVVRARRRGDGGPESQ